MQHEQQHDPRQAEEADDGGGDEIEIKQDTGIRAQQVHRHQAGKSAGRIDCQLPDEPDWQRDDLQQQKDCQGDDDTLQQWTRPPSGLGYAKASKKYQGIEQQTRHTSFGHKSRIHAAGSDAHGSRRQNAAAPEGAFCVKRTARTRTWPVRTRFAPLYNDSNQKTGRIVADAAICPTY